MKKTNFDEYVAKQFSKLGFAERYKQADEAWGVALQLADLRKKLRPRSSKSVALKPQFPPAIH
jgi:hypothetical protein